MTSAPEHELLAAARGDDREAFGRLVAPYRAEPHAHSDRMLGSVQDAEDALRLPAAGIPAAPAAALGRLRPAFTQTDDLGEPVGEPVWLEPFPTPQAATSCARASSRPSWPPS